MVDWEFTVLLLSNGILTGLMYSLIALGFVLVYKATDAVNFAQGEFVMFAGFVTVGGLTVAGVPLWLSVLAALVAMIAFGFGLERVVLRKLIGRPVIDAFYSGLSEVDLTTAITYEDGRQATIQSTVQIVEVEGTPAHV